MNVQGKGGGRLSLIKSSDLTGHLALPALLVLFYLHNLPMLCLANTVPVQLLEISSMNIFCRKTSVQV